MKQELLTKSEERELISRAQAGDRKALTSLVRRNEGLVHKQVHRFPLKNAQVTYDDLYQQGMLGFIHGVELFDLNRDIRLSTYVYRWIYAFMRRYFQNQGRVVRLPAHQADKKYQLDQKVIRLTKDELDELVPGYNELNANFVSTTSLNSALESGDELIDLQPANNPDIHSLEVSVILDLLRARVSERDYSILVSRFGLDGHDEKSLNEIAADVGVSRARTHQIVQKCINVLQEAVV